MSPKTSTSLDAGAWLLRRSHAALFASAVLVVAGASFAQDDGGGAPPGNGQPSVTVQLPAQPAPQVFVPGYPAPGSDINGYLPSSSRANTDTSRSTDGFDLNRPGQGDVSVRGNANGSFVVDGTFVPELHSVRRGDTLWEITSRYFNNPYLWPRVWAQNAHIQNPHWIYPGDRIRLRDAATGARASLLKKRQTLLPKTVVLRDYGWLDDPKDELWGEVVGSPEDHMFMTNHDVVYVKLDEDREVVVGQELTLFQPVRGLNSGAVDGKLVGIRGTVKIDRYNKETRMVRATVTESIDIIERGIKVGPVARKFDVVPPIASDVDVDCNIAAALYPHQFFGQNQVFIVDKGEKDGLKPGFRLFAIKRGDGWRKTIQVGKKALGIKPVLDADAPAATERVALSGDEKDYPDETYAELRVLRVRDKSATVIVVEAQHEIERTARFVARKGY